MHQDTSGHVTKELMHFQTCKIRYHHKVLFGDAESKTDYTNKRNEFWNSNRHRDVSMDTYENHSIDGGIKALELSLVNVADTPYLLGFGWYMLFSFIIPISAFYRIWVERMSVRTDFTFRKVAFLRPLSANSGLIVSSFRTKATESKEMIRALGSGVIDHDDEVSLQDRRWSNNRSA